MNIVSLQAKNIFSFDSNGIELADFNNFTQIVGPNGSGKTNLFRLLTMTSRLFGYPITDLAEYTYNGKNNNSDIAIKLKFRLSGREQEILKNFLICSALESQDNGSAPPEVPNTVAEAKNIVARNSQIFKQLSEKEILITIINSGLTNFKRPKIDIIFDGITYSNSTNCLSSEQNNKSSGNIPLAKIFIDKIREAHPDFLKKEELSDKDKGELIALAQNLDCIWLNELLKKNEVYVPGFEIQQLTSKLYNGKSNEVKEMAKFVEELARTLDIGPNNSSVTDFSWLFGSLYANSILMLVDARSMPRTVDLAARLNNDEMEINGISLDQQLFSLKNSQDKNFRDKFHKIQSEFETLTKVSFDVSYEPVEHKVPFNTLVDALSKYRHAGHKLELRSEPAIEGSYVSLNQVECISISDEPKIYIIPDKAQNYQTLLENSASGFFEILLILYSLIGAKDKIILLDEPAQNLHPNMQSKILELMCNSENQVIMSTHSPYMINFKNPKSIYRFEMLKKKTSINELKPLDTAAMLTITKEFGINNRFASILFARGVIILEGRDEEVALPVWYNKKYPVTGNFDENILWISADGKNHILTFKSISDDWNIPCIIICDKETYDVSDGKHEKLKAIIKEDKLKEVGKRKILHYSKNDFTDFYTDEPYKAAFDQAVLETDVDPSKNKKSPILAKLIAEKTEPPVEFSDSILQTISRFVKEPSDFSSDKV